ncbi:MAG: DEAD/DEAH box helicase [Clostridium sp.]|nr:DEAD/DEAH box helicase [Clostridium sp.]
MVYTEEIIQVYIEEYETESKKKRKNMVRPKDFRDRLTRLEKAMKRTKAAQVTSRYLEETHRQIRNLSYFAYRSHDSAAILRLCDHLLPELVRLDLSMFLPAQQEDISADFLNYLKTEQSGELCSHSLFELYQNYKRFVIEYKIMDLVPARPELEFPETLRMNRHFILHIGPTNSGKTFHSLERLKGAENGIYLGPLRLLALEVYEKMHDYGVPCTMLTGQECIADEHSRITASTIEMADFSQLYDVAVIDEAQMTADPDRGHNWTRAILGLKAKEIHVCMSPAAEEVVMHLIRLCGDDCAICRYERKTELICETESFSFPEDVRPGDALVVFSKKAVLDVAGRLEENGIKASVIYGSLPPEIRRRQMQLFTSGKTKVVVATDAIGMGLNLPVRRIVFIQTEKFDGSTRRGLSVPEIKQIAGRAGRFGIFNTGYVNAMGDEALAYIKERFDLPEETIHTVSLGFPQILLELDEPLDVILKVWKSVEPSAPFEKINIDEPLALYYQAEKHRNDIYGFDDKRILYKMITCPIDIKDWNVVQQWLDYCKNYPANPWLNHPGKGASDKKGIQKYESYYRKLDLYYQFSHRFDKIIDEDWLEKERAKTEGTIMQFLGKGKKTYIARCQYCGRMLPVGYPYRKCEQCFQAGRKGAKYLL